MQLSTFCSHHPDRNKIIFLFIRTISISNSLKSMSKIIFVVINNFNYFLIEKKMYGNALLIIIK